MKIALCWVLLLLPIGAVFSAPGDTDSRTNNCESSFEPATGSYRFVQETRPSFAVAEDTRIGQIYYTRLPIFDAVDPQENNAVYRWANRFHLLTRERVVSQQILFRQSQVYDERLLQESARLLRSQDYFYDVDIRPARRCGDKVDIEVITRDTWSLAPTASFDRSGGENTYSIGMRDSNILGLGKQLTLISSKDSDRQSYEVLYQDDNVFGSRIQTRGSLIDSDDGSNQLFELRLPFFSLDSRRAWEVSVENGEREDKQFFRGDDITEVEHEIEDFNVSYGFSDGLHDGQARRWTLGLRYRADRFAQAEDELPPPIFPIDKTVSYPYVGFESIEDDYVASFNLDQIYRTEDLHLGHRLISRLGHASQALGSDQDRIVVEGFYSDTLSYTEKQLWQHSLEWEGQWNLDTREAEDVIVTYQARYFRRHTARRSFFARLEAVYSRGLNSNRQILLGGLTGARAFENRFQVGDRRVVLSLEERLYSDIHLLNLIRVGGALFIDVGRAWEPGFDNGVEDDLLANIGFGIRLASSKAASGRVVHIDFAFPLSNRDDPDVDSFQIAFNIKGSF